jgi:hypothetical protein
MIIEGSCLCGGVAYEARGPLITMACCHCVQCRKSSGAEFATNGSVDSETFLIKRGKELLEHYESSPGKYRVFCRRCGSPLFKRDDQNPHLIRLRLGTVDTEIEQKPLARVFVSEKAAYTEILDDVPQYERLPGG